MDLRQPGSAARLPRVFLNYDKSPADECHLLVYRVSGVTVCLFIPAVVEPDHDLFTNLDNILAPRLTSMATDVAEHTLMRKNPPSAACNDSIRFLYFNQWNMAFKSTLHQSCPNLRRILHCPSSANIDIIQVDIFIFAGDYVASLTLFLRFAMYADVRRFKSGFLGLGRR